MSNASALTVEPVRTRQQQNEFLNLPWRLYKGDPHWIPPLRQNQRELVGFRPHPFYDDAEGQTFIARKGGEVVGRIAAIVNHAHNRYYNEQRGMFGFFESIDDTSVAESLFNAARQWHQQKGMEAMRGPVNPSLNYECGLLIEGFDSPPTFMMTYNHSYYPRLFDAAGLVKAQDLYSYYGHVDMLPTLDPKLAVIAQEATRRFQVKLRRMNRKRFKDELKVFLHIYNHALPGTWGFVPLSPAEMDHMAGGLRFLIMPELTTVAEVEGEAVGVVFGLLDYNPLIRKIDGRLFPFGFIRLFTQRRRITRVRLISTNVMPRFQRWGLGLVMMARLIPEVVAWGIKDAEFSWVLETNQLSRGSLERGGAKRDKTYRIYDLQWANT